MLLRLLFFFLLLFLFNSHGVISFRSYDVIDGLLRKLNSGRAPPAVQEDAVRGVLNRLLPSHISSFQFKIIPRGKCGGYSCFTIENVRRTSQGSAEILIGGTTAVEIASGLHWYLKYWSGAHISWDKTGGSQLSTVPKPGSLPRVRESGVMIQRPIPWSYYQNVVTSSYSFVWWDWQRWEKEIDWMALNGINLPLAFTGQESIWQKVFQRFNLSNADLDDFFSGPSYLAWARMGNLHGWGGPLSQRWLDSQLKLQKLILYRMLQLGMTPVLPSFSGNVPAALKKKFPAANISRLGDWNTVNGNPSWCCNFLLDPSDPLFVKIGQSFIEQQIKEYGVTTHIYNCDTFNENTPPTDDLDYISSIGAAVYRAMRQGDSDAVWLMQGWLFSSDSRFWRPPQMQALLHSVPFGRMIVLDLFADVKPIWEQSSQFYGTPYIWCMLHNFGGNLEMYGVLDVISSGPVDARMSQNSTMVGVGLCMEGIEQNPVVYELISEMAFRKTKVQAQGWIKSYARRRYGSAVVQLEEAWDTLYHTVYNCTDGIADHNSDRIVDLPDSTPTIGVPETNLLVHRSTKNGTRLSLRETTSEIPKPHLWYSENKVVHALQLFIDGGTRTSTSLTYRYDLVDLTRQVLSKLGNQIYMDTLSAFQDKDGQSLKIQSQKFIELIKDIDLLLASDDSFLLGTWLESAKKLAKTPEEKLQYEWNARTQVTMWYDTSPVNQSKLHDYANKYWSGLLQSYYLPRATSYFTYMAESLRQNKNFPLEKWRTEWISYSNKWQAGTETYPVVATGDSLAIAKSLFKKYFGS